MHYYILKNNQFAIDNEKKPRYGAKLVASLRISRATGVACGPCKFCLWQTGVLPSTYLRRVNHILL